MSIYGSLSDNGQCIAHTLASGASVTMTDVFPAGVNTVKITSSVDTTITFLFGGAPPAAAGNNTAAVTGSYENVGPSFPPAVFHSKAYVRTIGIKNTGAVSADLAINGWAGIRISGP